MLFYNKQHAKYFDHLIYKGLSEEFGSADPHHLPLMMFVTVGRELLRTQEEVNDSHTEYAKRVCDHVYALQTPRIVTEEDNIGFSGFETALKASKIVECQGSSSNCPSNVYAPHIASTYAALAILVTMKDNLDRLDRTGILRFIQSCQQEDGSFACQPNASSERDIRFSYCACAISYMLQDFSSIRRSSAVSFILNCQSFDGAFGLLPGNEGHGGATYCAVASLLLLGSITGPQFPVYKPATDTFQETDAPTFGDEKRRKLETWLIRRQLGAPDGGLCGRPGKSADTCYSFWIGATVYLLSCQSFFDTNMIVRWSLKCQEESTGGIGKDDTSLPDPMHTFHAICGISLFGTQNLRALNPILSIPEDSVSYLMSRE